MGERQLGQARAGDSALDIVGRVTPIAMPDGYDDVRIVTSEHAWTLESELRAGFIPILTWLDLVNEPIEKEPHYVPRRTWVLARRTERTHEVLRKRTEEAEAKLTDEQRKRYDAESALTTYKSAHKISEAAAAELRTLRDRMTLLERHLGAVRTEIGAARFKEITDAADGAGQPF